MDKSRHNIPIMVTTREKAFIVTTGFKKIISVVANATTTAGPNATGGDSS